MLPILGTGECDDQAWLTCMYVCLLQGEVPTEPEQTPIELYALRRSLWRQKARAAKTPADLVQSLVELEAEVDDSILKGHWSREFFRSNIGEVCLASPHTPRPASLEWELVCDM